MGDRKASHAEAQRKYAAGLRRKGTPRSDDLARATLAAFRDVVNREPGPGSETAWRVLVTAILDELTARGFHRQEAGRRLLRYLRREGPHNSS